MFSLIVNKFFNVKTQNIYKIHFMSPGNLIVLKNMLFVSLFCLQTVIVLVRVSVTLRFYIFKSEICQNTEYISCICICHLFYRTVSLLYLCLR